MIHNTRVEAAIQFDSEQKRCEELCVKSKRQLQSFAGFARQMRELSYLSRMIKEHREALVNELYRIAKRKAHFDNWARTERNEAKDFRRWRQFLRKANPRLRQALQELVGVAKLTGVLPKKSKVQLYFDWEGVRKEIIRAAKRLAHSIELAEELESTIAALINPGLRIASEKVLVKNELFERYDFSVKSKSSSNKHWLIMEAASRLDKYRDGRGKKDSPI